MDIAVYRPSTGEWWVRNQFTVVWGVANDLPSAVADGAPRGERRLQRRRDGRCGGVSGPRPALVRCRPGPVQLGVSADLPVPGDYDGNAVVDMAVYRPVDRYVVGRRPPPVQLGHER